MKSHKVEITVRAEFAAAHRLHAKELSDEENAALFGPCNNKNGHGHNYDLFVTVRGPVDPVTGMVMNLFDLHRIVKDHIFDVVDHRKLFGVLEKRYSFPGRLLELTSYWLAMRSQRVVFTI